MNALPYDGARVLVLGSGPRAGRARELLTAAGARLVAAFSAEVTYVVIDRSVPAHDPAVLAARRAAIPVLTTAELQNHPGMSALVEPVASPPMRMPAPRPVVPLPPRRRVRDFRRFSSSVPWALIPFLSLGLTTPAVIAYGAIRLRSWRQGLAVAGYAAAWLASCAGALNEVPGLFLLGVFGWLSCWLAGSAHGFILGGAVWQRDMRRLHPPAPAAVAGVESSGNAVAVAELSQRRELRRQARRLAETDPLAAAELLIGRPDLPRSYDDGGLVDINSAPATLLSTLPGVDAEVAEQIVRHRQVFGAFESTNEIVIHTNLDPQAIEGFDELALYLR